MASAAKKTGRAVGQAAGSGGTGRNPSAAIAAVAAAGAIIVWDIASGRTQMSEQQKLHTGIAFGIGAVILIGLADAVPELGVPLSVLLLLVVAVGRPSAIEGLASILKGAGGQAPAGPAVSGAAQAHQGSSTGHGSGIRTVGGT